MMENQWVQWVPLFGFGSVLAILMAIFGVGIGPWRNATIAYRNINDKIEWTRAKPHPGTRASRPQPYLKQPRFAVHATG